MPDLRRDGARHLPRAAAAEPGRHRDVLLAVHREADRETLHGRRQPRIPEDLARLHVEGAEVAIEIADKRQAAGGRQHRGEERRALLVAPQLLHRADVVGGQLADVALRPGHLEEPAIRGDAAAALAELDLPAHDLHARLAQRNDQRVGRLVVAHRLPVVPAFGARARLNPLLDLLLDDVGPIGRHAGLRDRCGRRRSGTPSPCARGSARSCDPASTGCPALPIVNTSFWPPTSTSTRSNTSSRSSDSPGACWKCHASLPSSTLSATVEAA